LCSTISLIALIAPMERGLPVRLVESNQPMPGGTDFVFRYQGRSRVLWNHKSGIHTGILHQQFRQAIMPLE
jgi:hypothetical protein